MRTFPKTVIHVFIFCLFTYHASAQAFKLDKDEQREIVERLCKLIRNRYVHENQGSKIADSLWHYFENRHYRSAYYDEELAFLLNQDLFRLSKDKSLQIQSKFVEVVKIDNQIKKKWIYKIFPSLQDKAYQKHIDKTLAAKEKQWYAAQNYGLLSAQMLEGGIGYLRINAFHDHEEAIQNLKNAVQFFKNTDYLLIDLSQFVGGQPEALVAFASFFVPKNTEIALLSQKTPISKTNLVRKTQISTLKTQKTDLFLGKKNIYLLTSQNTSAYAELLIHTLKKYGENVKIIGDTTAGITTMPYAPVNRLEFVFGNGSSESFYYLASDKAIIGSLELHLPESQLLMLGSDTTWLGRGFVPNSLCRSDTLVRFAHLQALKDKIRDEPDYNVKQFIDFQRNLMTLNTKTSMTTDQLQRFVGDYEKGRSIVLQNQTLYLKRGENDWVRLMPMGARSFLCETSQKKVFYFNNRLQPLFKIRFSENKDKKWKMSEIYADEMENRGVFLKLE